MHSLVNSHISMPGGQFSHFRDKLSLARDTGHRGSIPGRSRPFRDGWQAYASGKSHHTYLYNLRGHILSSVQIAKKAKYLGITLTDELSWSSHVHSIHSRANSTLGFLRRNLRRCPAKLKETAYITLVRSTLE